MNAVQTSRLFVFMSMVAVSGAVMGEPNAEQTEMQGSKRGNDFLVPADSGVKRSAPSGKASIEILAMGESAFVGKLRLAPRAKVPLHRDISEELIHVIEGSGVLFLDGIEMRIGPGDTVRMPAGAEVRFENGPEPMVVLQVFAGPASAEKYKTWVETRE